MIRYVVHTRIIRVNCISQAVVGQLQPAAYGESRGTAVDSRQQQYSSRQPLCDPAQTITKMLQVRTAAAEVRRSYNITQQTRDQ